jgi:hypothetical protein
MQMQAGLSKKKQNGAAGGYLGWHRGGAVVAVEGLRWSAELLLPLPLPPLFFFLLFSFSLQTILPSSFLFSFFFVLSALSLLLFFSLFFLFFRPSPFSPRLLFSFSSSSVFFSLSLSFLFFLPPSPFFVSPFSPLLIGEKRRSTPLPSQWCRGVG